MTQSKEQIDHPQHYFPNGGSLEVIEVIRDWGFAEGFCVGNAIKYLGRYKHKGQALVDLKKAQWYLDYYIKLVDAQTTSEGNSKA